MPLPNLRVSVDHRSLQTDTGQPFFYLGDTVWCLFQRATFDESLFYLHTRAHQGFNVYQAVALSEPDGLRTPNRYGHVPFEDLDPAKPVEAYWSHIDRVIDCAAGAGLYTALLPTWGDKFNKKWGIGPEVFTVANAGAYGEWIAKRYQHRPIIWVMGGDRPLETDAHLQIVRAMALGIRSVVGHSQLMTFHPPGGTSSSKWVQDEPWLDFNMIQSGHTGVDSPNWSMIESDRDLEPIRPTLDGEPNYENHPIMRTVDGKWQPSGGWFGDHDVRKTFWRSVLAGACGYTYGCHDIWQLYDAQRPDLPVNFARTLWRESLSLPGATQLNAARRMVESLMPMEPLPGVVTPVGHIDYRAAHPVAAAGSDGRTALIYLPRPGKYWIDLKFRLAVTQISAIVPSTLREADADELINLKPDADGTITVTFAGRATNDLLIRIE